MTACCSRTRAAASVLRHTALPWGYAVKLLEIEAATDKVLKTYESETKQGGLHDRACVLRDAP